MMADGRDNHSLRRHPERKRNHLNMPFGGVIEPSDQAFVDNVLNGKSDFDFAEMHLYSDLDRSLNTDNDFLLRYQHRLEYKGDVIWHLETTCYGGGLAVNGESSRCTLFDLFEEEGGDCGNGAILRVRVGHKGRKWKGDGCNSWQVAEYGLNGIVQRSAKSTKRVWD